MPAPLVIFTGTGTGIGKTFLAVATVRAWGRAPANVLGYKPIESGVVKIEETDGYLLQQASTFHVKPPPPVTRLTMAVSPNVAARVEGVTIDVEAIIHAVTRARVSGADAMVLELPGGLFSPVTDTLLAVDFVRRLAPEAVVLVAPDRLGVIHEVLATTEAARGREVNVTHVLLSPVATPDASSGSNAAELRRLVSFPIIDAAPFGDLAPSSVVTLLEHLRNPRTLRT